MGSRGERKQPGALVGEKSQTVFSANWKLDAMLLKNLQMLDVSKHRVSHRISMDQRVVNKRFQTKLYRSKITHARMTNNRELLRELLHRDNYTFNTSVGGQDEKYTVKVSPTQKIPGQEDSVARETLNDGNGKGVRPAATPVVVVESNDDGKQDTMVPRDVQDVGSDQGKDEKPSSVASLTQQTVRRLSNAAGMLPKQNSPVTLQEDAVPASKETLSEEQMADTEPSHRTQRGLLTDDKRKPRPNTAMPDLMKTTRTGTAKTKRPKTALARQGSGLLTAPSQDGKTSSSPTRQPSTSQGPTTATQRPTSGAPRPRSHSCRQQKHTMPSIFGEDKRPTLLDINRDRLARSNFPDRVRNFAGSLRGLQTDPDQTVDYYTHRLLENLRGASRRGPREFIESDAERRDAQRMVGNLNARNMTFGNVKKIGQMNHQDRPADGSPVRVRLRAWGSDDDDNDNQDNGNT
ncbi:uncharacterized protein LOC110984059 [Acanthaster planci]|uniref:Uncharacterized protein LOC110984059 n=1 Tax=Acanthaster planci TaxID=133434 RepID=A0A8B7Z3L6_ACAPL|nr:uncharacterized protein LOC110984059 [Acanthaster planci]